MPADGFCHETGIKKPAADSRRPPPARGSLRYCSDCFVPILSGDKSCFFIKNISKVVEFCFRLSYTETILAEKIIYFMT